MELYNGIGYEKACRLSNTPHSDIVPSLSLPSLPICFGSSDDASSIGDRPEILDHASVIAGLLRDCDVSYLNLKEEAKNAGEKPEERSQLYNEVLKYNPEAFECSFRALSFDKSSKIGSPSDKLALCANVLKDHHGRKCYILDDTGIPTASNGRN